MILQALILGIIQGLTEFIPVSSSAHLVAIPKLLGWKDMGLSFDVALHWGTLVALVIYFRRDWATILSSFVRREGSNTDVGGRMLLPIVVACVPAAVAGFLFDKKIEALRNWPHVVPVIALVLIAFGLVMLLAERISKKQRGMGEMNWIDYTIVGIAQSLALFPGVSRSGITISAGLFRNLDRAAAARFSFLLSTPIVFGAGLLKLKDVLRTGLPAGEAAPFAIGFIVSAVVGYLAIKFLMDYLRKKPLDAFVTYRICFAVILLLASQ